MTRGSSAGTVLVVALLVGVALGVAGAFVLADGGSGGTDPATTASSPTADEAVDEISQFDSAEAYQSYLQRGHSDGASPSLGPQMVDLEMARTTFDATDDVVLETGDTGAPAMDDTGGGDAGGSAGASQSADPPRTSGTNVQVQGVDEPDLVKTDGEWVYYANQQRARWDDSQRTQVLDAEDPPHPNRTGAIPAGGQLMLAGDTLVAIEDDTVYGFDVSDPEAPTEQWRRSLNHSVQTARLTDGTLYLVLRDRPDVRDPCPIRPMGPGADLSIPCTEVYHPGGDGGGDTTYTALSMDPSDGAVGDRVTFVGSAANTVVYASEGSIYLTFEDSPSQVEQRLAFLRGPGSEHLDQQAIDRLSEIEGYDLSPRARSIEVESAIEQRIQRLPDDERETVHEALAENYTDYVSENKREFVRSGVVRIGIDGTDLAVEETGEVPGRINGQFSLSERNGHLHVATTVRPPRGEWENDLYTLDSDLEIADSVTGMGTEQEIYSVRYVDDRAYLVTFRQVDPLHVVNISDPTDLELQGELELPGFSDYLHPVEEGKLLGIGEENRQVKATLFDVSDPEDPVVADDLILGDRWTAVSQSHHAFLLDERHGVFFLPGSEGGHVVDYQNGTLERVTTVETSGPALRARYIGDSLYVFAPNEVVVVDQTDWEVTERVDLG